MAIYIIYNLMYNIKAAWSLRYEPSLLQTGRVLFLSLWPSWQNIGGGGGAVSLKGRGRRAWMIRGSPACTAASRSCRG